MYIIYTHTHTHTHTHKHTHKASTQVYIHVPGFHLDIDSRDGKIVVLQNKGEAVTHVTGQGLY